MVNYTIDKGPAYTLLKVKLSPEESITVEPGSYMLHKGEVVVSTSSQGIASGLARLLGGESFFLNKFTAKTPVELWIAPSVPGDIVAIRLENQALFVQNTSYLAHVGDLKVSIGWRGLKGIIAEGSLFWLKVEGVGTVFVNSYGAIEELHLSEGEKVVVDNGHFVAMDVELKWSIRKLGGLKTLVFGGEGLVVEVVGPGRIWVQTRTLPALAEAIYRYLPKHERT